jgi:hypothetical protein
LAELQAIAEDACVLAVMGWSLVLEGCEPRDGPRAREGPGQSDNPTQQELGEQAIGQRRRARECIPGDERVSFIAHGDQQPIHHEPGELRGALEHFPHGRRVRRQMAEQSDRAFWHVLRDVEAERVVPRHRYGGREHPLKLLELEPGLRFLEAAPVEGDASRRARRPIAPPYRPLRAQGT